MQSNKGAAFFLRIAGVLLLITAIVAGLLAVVNQFTEKKIEENEQKQISDSIGALYEGSIEKQTLELSFGEAVVGAYRVYSDGAEAGVCFHVGTTGYGAVIGVMVGFERLPGAEYAVRPILIPIERVMLTERTMPDEYINARGNDVTEAFVEWCRPLIGEPLRPFVTFKNDL